MKKQQILILFISVLLVSNMFGKEIIGDGPLKITLEKLSKGVKVSNIKYNSSEIMDTTAISSLFTSYIGSQFISSHVGWDSVLVINDGTHCEIVLSQSIYRAISDSLNIKITLDVTGKRSDWDISFSGLSNNAIDKIYFPYINILATGSDYFLMPKYSGQLFKNPRGNLNASLSYPRGWSSTMQFCAYYNDNYGIYLGTHDPAASFKTFNAKYNNKGGVLYNNEIPAPDRGLNGNDYEMSGVFHFEMFEGNWYDAAQIYKKWASAEADYWPVDTEERRASQDSIGQIGVWVGYYDQETPEITKTKIKEFQEYMGVPLGVHWYNWNYNMFDDNYPIYFPERDQMDEIISECKSSAPMYFMPYINGRLFETNLNIYPTQGEPYATKKADGSVYTQTFMGNTFAVMCPTQRPWQDILIDASDQLTHRIGTDAVYLDQVTAASAINCMDPTHGHTLGGGNFWRSGYYELLNKIHKTAVYGSFVTTEGCNDYLVDVVDGYLTDGWTTNNLVPAFQAVYSGKVQLFGTRTGTGSYNDPSFYCKLSQSFVNGVQPGRFSIYLVRDPNSEASARPYVRQIARMRYKLRDYLAFGSMIKPIPLDRSGIPTITTLWKDYGSDVYVTISALQYSFWKNQKGDKTTLIFANASMTQTLNFTVNFTGSDYGLIGDLSVQKITEDSEGEIVTEENTFSRDLVISPKEVFSLIITPDSVTAIDDTDNKLTEYKLGQNYPNPFNPSTEINFTIPSSGQTSLIVYNVLGQQMAELVNNELNAGEYRVTFNGESLPSGLYFYQLKSNKFFQIKKMILLR